MKKPEENKNEAEGSVESGDSFAGKAEIVRVGWIDGDQPHDFLFDCKGMPMRSFTEEGKPLWGNWTLDELREVVARPDEFSR